ncbi:MAG: hypothetical protein HYZ67_07615 [Chlamydiae bacterium]|nr:hypothetical protein [Chlamydiota bacterium]
MKALEMDTNHKKLESEYLEFLEVLEKQLPKEELKELLRQVLEHRLGQVSDEEHYLYLSKYLSRVQDSQKYKNLELLFQQMKFLSEISWTQLDNEIHQVEEKIFKVLLREDREKELFQLQDDYRRLKRIVNLEGKRGDVKVVWGGSFSPLKISQGDYPVGTIKSCKSLRGVRGVMKEEELTPPVPLKKIRGRKDSQREEEYVKDFLYRLKTLTKEVNSEANNLSSPILEDFGEIFVLSQKFYAQVLKRDQIMFEKSLEIIQEKKLTCAALVVGGFHTEGITKKLKEAKIGYWVIAPRMTGHNDRSAYFRKMKEQFGFVSGAPDALKRPHFRPFRKSRGFTFLRK